MATKVKVCGITRLEDARLATDLGAAALGFNFYPPSPRYIAPALARNIIRELPPFVTTVGVFANEIHGAHVAAVAREAGVRTIQLHGPEAPGMNGALENFQLIRAVAVGAGFQPSELMRFKANAYLLDTFDPALYGGTGKTFEWSLVKEAARYGPILLAGGLTPENVGQAIHEVRPYAVDVATGVESGPGQKDTVKMRAFFAAVEAADQSL